MDQDLRNKSKQPPQEALEKTKNITINILASNEMIANIMTKKFYHKFNAKNKQ